MKVASFIAHLSSLIATHRTTGLSACWLVSLFLPFLAFAQPDTLWTRSFDNGGDDYAVAALQTEGGFVLAASVWDGNSIGFGLTRTDATGNALWVRSYGDGENNWCSSIVDAGGGGWLLGGFTFQSVSIFIDALVVRVNTAGDTLWTRTIGDSASNESISAMLALADGGFLLIGDLDLTGQGFPDLYFVRLNSAGEILWTRTYASPAGESTSGICLLSDGNYLVCGSQYLPPETVDFYFVKLTTSGDTLWTRKWGGDGYDLANDIQALPDGGAVFSGLTDSFGEEGDLFAGRLNSSGDTVWTRTYGGQDHDHAHAITLTGDGGFVIAGHTDSPPAVEGDIYAVKTDSEGHAQWVFTLPGSDYESFESVRQTSDGGLILSGNHANEELTDMFLMRLENITAIAAPHFIPHPSSFILSSYPNPFNATTNISFSLAQSAPVRLRVYDLTGRVVATLIDAPLAPGAHELSLDASLWPSGLYICALESQGITEQQKLLLLK